MRLSRFNVQRITWRQRGQEPEDCIRIYVGEYFVRIPFEHARAVVDKVHDFADEYERELREKGNQ